MFTPVSMRLVNSYRNVGLETTVTQANPHRLIGMLFEALLQALSASKAHTEARNFAEKGQSIIRAVRILEEGLKAVLDMQNGGEVAAELRALYDYCIYRTSEANMRNDAAMIQEVIDAIQPVANAWTEIGPEVMQIQRAA